VVTITGQLVTMHGVYRDVRVSFIGRYSGHYVTMHGVYREV
jgi:hydrogenase maturation factor